MDKLTGIHAVREALVAGRPLQTVIVGRGRHGDRWTRLSGWRRAPAYRCDLKIAYSLTGRRARASIKASWHLSLHEEQLHWKI